MTTSTPATAAVQVYLLGGFRVVVDGRTLGEEVWHRRSARQLFKYLLSRPYRRASREEAVEFLWPDGDPIAGARNLRPTLTALRHALSELITTAWEYIEIHQGPELWVDADTFERAITQPWPADPDLELARLEQASRLYTGHYLPDDWFEEANGRREALKRRWAPLGLRLARLYEERGDREAAIEALEGLIRLDSSDEDAALELMRVLASSGRRADAVHVFERIKRHLAEDLDVQPSEPLLKMRLSINEPGLPLASAGSAEIAAASAREPAPVPDSSAPGPTVILVAFDQPTASAGNQQLRQAIIERGGQVLEARRRPGPGELCFGVFRRAGSAVSLADQIQRERRTSLPGNARPRVAIHTSVASPLTVDNLDALLAACEHLAAVTHPGQVLLSAQTVLGVVNEGVRLDGSVLVDMGEHRLRPDSPVEHIFQLAFTDRPGEFPGLANGGRLPFGLPPNPPNLIGREVEVQQIIQLLRRVRLVTLTGSGGVGKSRLALHVAHHLRGAFQDDACFVSLETISDAELVAPAIAQRLGVPGSDGDFLRERLAEFLHTRELLLVLDNFEQVAPEIGLIHRLIHECPGLEILITSQKHLDLDPQYGATYEVAPLKVPAPHRRVTVAQLGQFSAAQMFVDRARAVRPDFSIRESDAEAVAEICRRLDGLPLSIELAAARVRMMRPAEMTRLKSLLSLLTSGPGQLPERHRTLRASITWSFHLLINRVQVLFARLAAFAGGFTLDAAEQVCGGGSPDLPLETQVLDGIDELITMSLLVRRDEGQGSRYRMLETIREYGLEALEASGETQMVLRRHAAYYLDRARLAEEQLRGVGQSTALAELATEHDNIRAALRWARGSHENDLGLGLELAARVWRFWLLNGNLSEGRAWLEDALKQPQAVDAGVLARALVAAGELACAAGDLRSAMGHADRSLAFYRAIHDDTGIAQSLHIRGYCIASRAQSDAEYLEAATLQRECLELERRRGDRAGVAKAQHALGEIARYSQNYSDAWTRLHAAWRERKELVDRDGEGWSAHCLAWVAYERGVDLPLALEWADRALSVWESFPSESRHGRSATRSLRARIAVRLGDRQAAIADVLESLTLWPLLRYTDWLIYDLLALALVATSPEPTSETAYSAAVLLSAARALHTDAVRPPKHRRREPLRIWNQIRPHLGIDRRAAARSQGRRMDAEAAHAFASDLARQLRLDATGHDSHPAA